MRLGLAVLDAEDGGLADPGALSESRLGPGAAQADASEIGQLHWSTASDDDADARNR
jgi:hypothetical protein